MKAYALLRRALELIAVKIEQGDQLDTAATFGQESESPDQGEVVDLMEALRRSVEKNRANRGTAKRAPPPKKKAKKSTKKAR